MDEAAASSEPERKTRLLQGPPNLLPFTLSERYRQRDQHRVTWRLVLTLCCSTGLHWLGFYTAGLAPEPRLIEFRLVDPSTPEPSASPQFLANADARASGSVRRPDPSGSIVRAAPSRRTVVAPTQPPLAGQLDRAVAQSNWRQALRIVDQLLVVYPQQSERLLPYREHLRQLLTQSELSLQNSSIPQRSLTTELRRASPALRVNRIPVASTRIASPAPALVVSPSDPVPTPISTPFAASPAPTIAAAPLFPRASQAEGWVNPTQMTLGPASLAAQADLDWGGYLTRLQGQVRRHWQVQRAPGSYVTVVRFTVDRTGALQDVQLQATSSDPLVDAAVLSAIRQSAPFEPLLQGYPGERLTFEVSVLSGSIQVTSQ